MISPPFWISSSASGNVTDERLVEGVTSSLSGTVGVGSAAWRARNITCRPVAGSTVLGLPCKASA